MDMNLITEHQINKAKTDKTENRNRLNCNYCHVVYHINRLKKQAKTKHMIIPIDAEKTLGKTNI